VINYLARLGWSHGDDEVFSPEQFCQWFDLDHITPSAAQFNTEKLNWLNHEYIKKTDIGELAQLLTPFLDKAGLAVDGGPPVQRVVELLRDRSPTLVAMAEGAHYFYARPHPSADLLAQHLTDGCRPAMDELMSTLQSVNWTKPEIGTEIKRVIAAHGLKMPQLMMPLRVLLTGQTQTPSVDAVMDVLGRHETLARLGRASAGD
jgi:glutamyl-tRNA synthetase